MTLARLIEAVELGDDDVRFGALGDHELTAAMAHAGSLDAAAALHEALLPGWIWGITSHDDQLGIPAAYVANRDDLDEGYEAHNEVPARALLLADFKAYAARAMEGRDG